MRQASVVIEEGERGQDAPLSRHGASIGDMRLAALAIRRFSRGYTVLVDVWAGGVTMYSTPIPPWHIRPQRTFGLLRMWAGRLCTRQGHRPGAEEKTKSGSAASESRLECRRAI